MTKFFDSVQNRMPHFFNDVDVLEYVPHSRSKKIRHMFSDSRYFVIDPNRNNLEKVESNTFSVTMSIDYFQSTSNFIEQFQGLHRVSSKFVMFSCASAGRKPTREGYYKNLTTSDFYNSLDFDKMFERYFFDVDYLSTELNFWGVKRNKV